MLACPDYEDVLSALDQSPNETNQAQSPSPFESSVASVIHSTLIYEMVHANATNQTQTKETDFSFCKMG